MYLRMVYQYTEDRSRGGDGTAECPRRPRPGGPEIAIAETPSTEIARPRLAAPGGRNGIEPEMHRVHP
jgi:hypothetical protein